MENTIERIFALSNSSLIEPADLPEHMRRLALSQNRTVKKQYSDEELPTLKEAEKELILKTLRKYGENKSKAADSLGITRATLYRKMNEYNIPVF